jgi:ketosteroid isomerase-like protein
MLTSEDGARFAEEWFAAWNDHDLDAILTHYTEDVEFVSPFVAALNDDPAGAIHGRDELRAYFTRAFERFPDLRFEPLDVLVGVSSVTLYYVSVESRRAAEVMTLGPDGRVTHVLAHYRDAGGPSKPE